MSAGLVIIRSEYQWNLGDLWKLSTLWAQGCHMTGGILNSQHGALPRRAGAKEGTISDKIQSSKHGAMGKVASVPVKGLGDSEILKHPTPGQTLPKGALPVSKMNPYIPRKPLQSV